MKVSSILSIAWLMEKAGGDSGRWRACFQGDSGDHGERYHAGTGEGDLLTMHPSLISQFSLAGKSAIVTGASRGLGMSFARGLAKRDAT